MASVKRYQVYCSKCQHQLLLPPFIIPSMSPTGSREADNHDCKAHGDAVAKAHERGRSTLRHQEEL
jgi:hypothetical protein